MHAFGLGYGVGFAVWFAAAMVRWATQNPPPAGPATAGGMAFLAGIPILILGYVLVVGSLTSSKDYDTRRAFRAADPRGWKNFAAGVVSGLVAVGIAVLVHVVIQPSGQERDLNTIRAGILAFLAIGLTWLPGAVLYIWLFRRPTRDALA